MKTVVATSRDWPYFLFVFLILSINVTIISLWGLSLAVVIAFIPALWLLYDVLHTRSAIAVSDTGVMYTHGLRTITIPWSQITSFAVVHKRIDRRYVVIHYKQPATTDEQAAACISLSHIAAHPEDLQAVLTDYHLDYQNPLSSAETTQT